MGWRWEKTVDEFQQFWHEVVIENGPRYKDPREWHHLYVDFLNSWYDMNYTLAHVEAFLLPVRWTAIGWFIYWFINHHPPIGD